MFDKQVPLEENAAMVMSDDEIRAVIESREIVLEPFDPARVEPASHDIRLGTWAFGSSSVFVVLGAVFW
jgi:deoxycytidine triphosphate deaminase